MQIKDLVVTGDARILGNLYTKDGSVGTGGGGGGDGGSGVTYRLTKSGSTITLTGSDGSTSSVTDTDTNTTYTLSSLGAAPASHTHDDRYYTESEVNSLLGGKAPSSHSHGYIQDGTVGIKASDSNEISFISNANYIYFGYENRAGSSGIVDTYKFGTHSGVNNASKGIIECGKVIEGGTELSSKYAPKYQYSTSDLTAGSSSLATGTLYFVYE